MSPGKIGIEGIYIYKRIPVHFFLTHPHGWPSYGPSHMYIFHPLHPPQNWGFMGLKLAKPLHIPTLPFSPGDPEIGDDDFIGFSGDIMGISWGYHGDIILDIMGNNGNQQS